MITLSKIAKEAHVSVSTASKAFSGSPEVNDQTRQIIFDVAKKYGCFKKFFNAKYSKYVIAVICPEFSSAHYTRYLAFLRHYLDEENCEICVAETNFSHQKERELLEYYYKHADVDAIIVIGSHNDITAYHEIPVLFLSIDTQEFDSPSVICNVDTALEEALDYLIDKGVTDIGFIGERLTIRKRTYFQSLLKKKGLPCNESYMGIADERFEVGGYKAMESILASGSYPRAVYCAYDNMAIGAIRCVIDHGLRVPEDIAILGTDDIPSAPYLVPPLASIDSHADQTCLLATKTIIAMINGKDIPTRQEIAPVFHLRRSFEID